VYPTIVLSTDTKNWGDYHAFQLSTSTAQYELIDMSHNHESCMSRFLLICSLIGCKGTPGELVLRWLEGYVAFSKANIAPSSVCANISVLNGVLAWFIVPVIAVGCLLPPSIGPS
jgi:hypothetical protein